MSDKKPKKVLKKNYLELLNQKAKPILSMKDHNPDKEAVPTEITALKEENKELELLKHQLTNRPNDVNSFLLAKYSDGTAFAAAHQDKYDNSEERIKSGISFTYHVFYKIDPNNKGEFPNNKYVITDKLVDAKTGDEYFYHFPVRRGHFENVPYYRLDYFDELITPEGIPAKPDNWSFNKNRIFYALQTLAQHMKLGNPILPREAYNRLVDNGFMDNNGKLNLAVKTGVMVEKYFLKFNTPDRRIHGIEYLEKQINTLPKTIDVPEHLITAEAVGPPADVSSSNLNDIPPTTTTTTAKPKTDDDAPDILDDLTPEMNDSFRRVKSYGSKELYDIKKHPLPDIEDDFPTVLKKLKARGIKIKIFKGSPSNYNSTIEKSEYPLPICFGNSGVAFIYCRPLAVGLNLATYLKHSQPIYKDFIKSITQYNMISKVPISSICQVIKRDFGVDITDGNVVITDINPINEKNKYKVVEF